MIDEGWNCLRSQPFGISEPKSRSSDPFMFRWADKQRRQLTERIVGKDLGQDIFKLILQRNKKFQSSKEKERSPIAKGFQKIA